MSSNIPLARHYLEIALKYPMHADAELHCRAALRLMRRSSPVRRAPPTPGHITPDVRRAVRALRDSDLTMHEIANRVGLANGGRVSEIMRRRR